MFGKLKLDDRQRRMTNLMKDKIELERKASRQPLDSRERAKLNAVRAALRRLGIG